MQLPDLVVESLSSGLLVCDQDDVVVYANPAAAFTLGREPAAMVGRHIESVIGSQGAQALLLQNAVAGEAQEPKEGVWERADCTAVTVGFSASPLRAATGEVAGTVLLFREISEVNRLRRNMSRAEALASVGILASGIAHQIRNPLAGIRSSVQALQRKLSPGAKERDRLQRVLAEIDRINNLIKSLLDFARPKAPAFEVVDLPPLLQDVLDLIGPAMARAGITAEQKMDLPAVRLRADRQRLQEALLNILLNAVQAMPHGGRIMVRGSFEPDAGDAPGMVKIEVSDTGPGIPPERAERIFQPFYTTRSDGTGLGLAVARQVVEEYGGSVAVRSTPGEGATFVLRLPVHERSPGPAA